MAKKNTFVIATIAIVAVVILGSYFGMFSIYNSALKFPGQSTWSHFSMTPLIGDVKELEMNGNTDCSGMALPGPDTAACQPAGYFSSFDQGLTFVYPCKSGASNCKGGLMFDVVNSKAVSKNGIYYLGDDKYLNVYMYTTRSFTTQRNKVYYSLDGPITCDNLGCSGNLMFSGTSSNPGIISSQINLNSYTGNYISKIYFAVHSLYGSNDAVRANPTEYGAAMLTLNTNIQVGPVQTCHSAADTDCNNLISTLELNNYAIKWVNNQITLAQLIEAASAWVKS